MGYSPWGCRESDTTKRQLYYCSLSTFLLSGTIRYPDSSCSFPVPALESAATLKSPGFFSWEWYLKAEIWELSVLIVFGVPLLPDVARVREYVYLPLCTCIQTFAFIFVSVFIHIYIYDKMSSH